MLEPKNIRLVWKDDGIQIEIDGSFQRVGRIVRAFPKTNPNQYVGFLASDGEEIGLLKNPNELDIVSSKLLSAELTKTYFVPTISKICSVIAKGTGSLWNVLTDDGERIFRIQSRDALDGLDPPSIRITDENGKHYFIENYWALDTESRQMISELLPDKIVKARSGRISIGGRGGRSSKGNF